jgi:hypothetical protein
LLEIPEYPEFLISGSNYSDISSANFNNLYQLINTNVNDDITNKIGIFSAFLNKSTTNNSNFELLKNCNDQIQNELNSIRKFENFISAQDNLREKLKNSNNSAQLLNLKKKEYFEMEEKLNNLEKVYDDLVDKIRANKEKEESRNNMEDPNAENKIKNRIKELKVI